MVCARNGLFVKVVFSLITVIAMVACYLPTPVEQEQLLEAHWEVRENVHPPASNMQLLRYSKKLEGLAESWILQCNFPIHFMWPYHVAARNFVVIGGKKPNIIEGVYAWKKEAKNYNYYDNSCSGSCIHYTQMVWATATEVGCAMEQCDDLVPNLENPQYLIVCAYSPLFRYGWQQRPYEQGPSCSQYPSGWVCYRNQCVEKLGSHHKM